MQVAVFDPAGESRVIDVPETVKAADFGALIDEAWGTSLGCYVLHLGGTPFTEERVQELTDGAQMKMVITLEKSLQARGLLTPAAFERAVREQDVGLCSDILNANFTLGTMFFANSPLLLAARSGNMEILDLILAHRGALGVAGEIDSVHNNRAQLAAVEAQHIEVLMRLLREGGTARGVVSAMLTQSSTSGVDLERVLTHLAPYVPLPGEDLLLKAMGREVDAVGALRMVAKSVRHSAGSKGRALMYAVARNDVVMVRCLVDSCPNGVAVNGRYAVVQRGRLRRGMQECMTPMHLAYADAKYSMMSVLHDLGASLELVTNGQTMLWSAASCGDMQMVQWLLAHNAKITTKCQCM